MEDGSIMFLLGAGASCDAGIPMAIKMNEKVEALIAEDKDLQNLYFFLKSSIMYQRGLEGSFNEQVGVEDLLGVIEELNQKHKNKLYPFVGAWSPHLVKVAGHNFSNIERLDKQIRSGLVNWVKPPNGFRDGSYFQGLGKFHAQYGYSIPIFTLNYDLLVERNLKAINLRVETGFGADYKWNASRFERNDADDVNFYLYKLHGSIDWERNSQDKEDFLFCRDDPCEVPDLIFGVHNKLNSGDPYLFYVHELRKYSLENSTRLIFVVGYSFSDGYINKLLSQAIRQNPRKRIINVAPNAEESQAIILQRLKLDQSPSSIIPLNFTGKFFFEKELTIELCQKYVPKDDEAPF